MNRLQPVRGTHDLLPKDGWRHRHVVEIARGISERYCFSEISTPVFEFTEVFKRTLGEFSDVVSKEMYTFLDRGGDEITLRPEYTAGITRAVISGGLFQNLPLRFFAHGPMFRYERPQKGRLRQFHQIDAEIIGVGECQADIEVISLGFEILKALGIQQSTTLELNSLGNSASRTAYREALVAYFCKHRESLSLDSQNRLEHNPLRILDSKDEGDRALAVDAPKIQSYWDKYSENFFSEVLSGLDSLGFRYRLNPHLVRGLDYYSHTAFEFVTSELGSQGAVIAGGRYDGLMEAMGGPPTPAVGWAGGIERLAMLAKVKCKTQRPIAIIPVGEDAQEQVMALAYSLRCSGFKIDVGYRGNVSRRMRRANKIDARAAILLGENETESGVVTLRDLDSGEQSEIPRISLEDVLELLI